MTSHLEAMLEAKGSKLCQRCKCCELVYEDCSWCGGEGETMPGDLYDEDPLWYGQEDTESCHQCGGRGSFGVCLGSCDEHGEHAAKDV